MLTLDALAAGEVGDGAGDLDDALVGTGGEVEVGHGALKHLVAGSIQLSVLVQEGGIHLGVAVDALDTLVPFLLYLPCLDDPFTDCG